MNKEEAMEKYTELQMLDQQTNQIQQQLSLLENKLIQLKDLQSNLDDLNKTKEGTEILAPIGAGIFVKSAVKDPKNVLMNIGGDVVVKKDVVHSKKLIEEQVIEIEDILGNLSKELAHFNLKSQSLRQELQSGIDK